MTSLSDRKALSRRALELWASGNSDRAGDIVSADYLNHQEPTAAAGAKPLDLAGWKAAIKEHRDAFSKSGVEILLQVAEGDFVASHWRFTVTHSGDYLGRPATGQEISWTGVQIDRFENGRIVESWVNWDKFPLFEALGLLN